MASEVGADAVKDYYFILGVERGASAQSIKAAYRRLAREHHPDFVTSQDDAIQAQASVRMAELNEAYDILSNSDARRAYDESWQQFSMNGSSFTARPAVIVTPEDLEIAAVLEARTRPRPTDRVTGSVVTAFAKRLCQELIDSRGGLVWKRNDRDGFNWSLTASAWPARFWVHMRSVEALDPGVAERYTERAGSAVRASKRLVGRDSSLFVLAFYRLEDPDQVTTMCRRFRDEAAKLVGSGGDVNLALIDVVHARMLPYGPSPADSRFAEVIRSIGLNLGRSSQH